MLTDKGKHLVKVVDQPNIKLVQRSKCKSRKIRYNYNNKLRDSNKHKKKYTQKK